MENWHAIIRDTNLKYVYFQSRVIYDIFQNVSMVEMETSMSIPKSYINGMIFSIKNVVVIHMDSQMENIPYTLIRWILFRIINIPFANI